MVSILAAAADMQSVPVERVAINKWVGVALDQLTIIHGDITPAKIVYDIIAGILRLCTSSFNWLRHLYEPKTLTSTVILARVQATWVILRLSRAPARRAI